MKSVSSVRPFLADFRQVTPARSDPFDFQVGLGWASHLFVADSTTLDG